MRFNISDLFFSPYQKCVQEFVIPYQEKILHDELPGIEKSHAVENFRLAAEVIKNGSTDGQFYGMVFQDSDVAKWLEAAAYSLSLTPDPALEKRCDALIELIGAAQHTDGYLNTYFTVKKPEKRWTNLCEAHELYCAGHMMEAAVAYAQATGKTQLLDIMARMAGHIYEHFITQETPGFPGHPEIELALMRMYSHTGDEKYLQLAGHFINVRGVDADYFWKESKKRGWYVWGMNPADNEYAQNNAPVRELTEATGHAVRAVYLYAGMADYAAATGDDTLIKACETLWQNITQKRMYVTGAIGSAYEGEAFTTDYHLPNDTAYAETCASIGLMFFAQKMLRLQKRGEYADIMERALYNTVLAGMQQDGTRFFYVNPLEVVPGTSGVAKTHRHALPERPTWFACACCPPNVARLLTSLNQYACDISGGIIYSHLFIGGTLDVTEKFGGKIIIKTEYPYSGEVEYKFQPAQTEMPLTLAIRLASWSENTEILLNNNKVAYETKDGYAYITRAFTADDRLTVHFDMSPQYIFANPKINANSGKLAISRGPLIYCAEGVDNDDAVLDLLINKNGKIKITENNNLLAEGFRLNKADALYTYKAPEKQPCDITLIPYFSWGNRGLNEMRVWIPYV